MRLMASHEPLIAPYLRKACSAYSLHVGVYRHDGGNIGDIAAL
jgi:hypothetical protein